MLPEEGYKRGKEILRQNFGRTQIVTKAFLDKVVLGPPIRTPDPEKLSELARDMETCLLGSTRLGYKNNLDSIDTLSKIVGLLPTYLRSRWAEKANQLYEAQITPAFSYLSEFVHDKATVANTYFGKMIASNETELPKDDTVLLKGPLHPHGNKTMVTGDVLQPGSESGKRTFTCVLCAGAHHLERCQKFRAQTLQQCGTTSTDYLKQCGTTSTDYLS